MSSPTDFRSTMTAIRTISDISQKAVDVSVEATRTRSGKIVTAAVLAGAIAMAFVMQDANAMATLHPHSLVTETLLQISGGFGCEGDLNAEITMATLEGMDACATLIGEKAMGDPQQSQAAVSVSPMMTMVAMATEMSDKVGAVAAQAWTSLTADGGAVKTGVEVLAAALAVIEAIKLIRDAVQSGMERLRGRRREDETVAETQVVADATPPDTAKAALPEAANDDRIFAEAANDNDYDDGPDF